MSVTLRPDAIILSGDCGAEEAETLLALIQTNPDLPVDIAGAGWIHTALWQVILALAPKITGRTSHEFIQRWLLPLVKSGTPDTTAA